MIDLSAGTPMWTATGSMSFARRQFNLTVLPDGTVLATGGTSSCGFSPETGAVFAAELYDPKPALGGPLRVRMWCGCTTRRPL